MEGEDLDFSDRLMQIHANIDLGMECILHVGFDGTRYFFQIHCWRKDAITGEYDWGRGGKAYLSPYMATTELVQAAFGLYKGYWEHEARETFQYKERRIFGPHIDVEAQWEIARRVDLRSAQHVEDRS